MKLRLTESSINSIDIRMTIRFFRFRKIPTMPIANKTAANIKKWDSVSKMPPDYSPHVAAKPATTLIFTSIASYAIRSVVNSILFLGRHLQEPYTILGLDENLLRRTDRFILTFLSQRQRNCRDNPDQQHDGRQFKGINVFSE